jgi:hypothetical protein
MDSTRKIIKNGFRVHKPSKVNEKSTFNAVDQTCATAQESCATAQESEEAAPGARKLRHCAGT